MQRIIAIALFLAAAASAQARWWTNELTGAIAPNPTYRPANAINAPPDYFLEPGWTEFTLSQQAELDAFHAAAAAQAAAEAAQYADPQPAVFLPRFSGDITNVVGLSQALVDDATDEIVAVDETGSPEHTLAQKREQNAARKAKQANAIAAIESAGKKGKVNDRLDAIEAALKEMLK